MPTSPNLSSVPILQSIGTLLDTVPPEYGIDTKSILAKNYVLAFRRSSKEELKGVPSWLQKIHSRSQIPIKELPWLESIIVLSSAGLYEDACKILSWWTGMQKTVETVIDIGQFERVARSMMTNLLKKNDIETLETLGDCVQKLKDTTADKETYRIESLLEDFHAVRILYQAKRKPANETVNEIATHFPRDSNKRSFYCGVIHADLMLHCQKDALPERLMNRIVKHFLAGCDDLSSGEYFTGLVVRLFSSENGMLPAITFFREATKHMPAPILSSHNLDDSFHFLEENGLFDLFFTKVLEGAKYIREERLGVFMGNIVPVLSDLSIRNEISRECLKSVYSMCSQCGMFNHAERVYELDAEFAKKQCNLGKETSRILEARLELLYLYHAATDMLRNPQTEAGLETWRALHQGIQRNLISLDGEAQALFPSLKSLENQPNAIKVLTQMFAAPSLSDILSVYIDVLKANESKSLDNKVELNAHEAVQAIDRIDKQVRRMHEILNVSHSDQGFTLKALLHSDSFFSPISAPVQEKLIYQAVSNKVPFSIVWDLYEWMSESREDNRNLTGNSLPHDLLNKVAVTLVESNNVEGLFTLLSSVNDGFWRVGLNKLNIAMNSNDEESRPTISWLYYILDKEESLTGEGPLNKLVDLLKEEEAGTSGHSQQAYIALAYIREAYKLFHGNRSAIIQEINSSEEILEPVDNQFAMFFRDRSELINRQITTSFALSSNDELTVIRSVLDRAGRVSRWTQTIASPVATSDATEYFKAVKKVFRDSYTDVESKKYSLIDDPVSVLSQRYLSNKNMLETAAVWGLHHGYCGKLPCSDKNGQENLPIFLWKDSEIIDFVRSELDSVSLVRPSSAAVALETLVYNMKEWMDGNLPPFEFVQNDSQQLSVFDQKQTEGADFAHRAVLEKQVQTFLKDIVQPTVQRARKEYAVFAYTGFSLQEWKANDRVLDYSKNAIEKLLSDSTYRMDHSVSPEEFLFRIDGSRFQKLSSVSSKTSLPSLNPKASRIDRYTTEVECDRPNGLIWPWGDVRLHRAPNEWESAPNVLHDNLRLLSDDLRGCMRLSNLAIGSEETLWKRRTDAHKISKISCADSLSKKTEGLESSLSQTRKEISQKWMGAYKLTNFGLWRDEMRLMGDMNNVINLGKAIPWPLRKSMSDSQPHQEPKAIHTLKARTAKALAKWKRCKPVDFRSDDKSNVPLQQSIEKVNDVYHPSEEQALLTAVESPAAINAAHVYANSFEPENINQANHISSDIIRNNGQFGNCFVFTRTNLLPDPIPHPVLGYYRNTATAEGYKHWIRFAVPLMQQYTVQTIAFEYERLGQLAPQIPDFSSKLSTRKFVSAALGEVGLPVEWYFWALGLHHLNSRFPKSNERVIRSLLSGVNDDSLRRRYLGQDKRYLREIDSAIKRLRPFSLSIVDTPHMKLRARTQEAVEDSFEVVDDQVAFSEDPESEVSITDEIVSPETGIQVATKVNSMVASERKRYAVKLEKSTEKILNEMTDETWALFRNLNRQSDISPTGEDHLCEVSWMPDRSDTRNRKSKYSISNQQATLITQVSIERAMSRKENIRQFGFRYLQANTVTRALEATEFLQKIASGGIGPMPSPSPPSTLTPISTHFLRQFQGSLDVESLARLWIVKCAPWCLYQTQKQLAQGFEK